MSIQSLPEIEEPNTNQDSRKCPWESSQEGYLHWAVQKLVERARAERKSESGSSSYLSSLAQETDAVASVSELKNVLKNVEA